MGSQFLLLLLVRMAHCRCAHAERYLLHSIGMSPQHWSSPVASRRWYDIILDEHTRRNNIQLCNLLCGTMAKRHFTKASRARHTRKMRRKKKYVYKRRNNWNNWVHIKRGGEPAADEKKSIQAIEQKWSTRIVTVAARSHHTSHYYR